MPEINCAERAGVGHDGRPRPTEDRIVLLSNAVVLLDGATSPTPRERDGGWHSRHLAAELTTTTALDGDLADALAAAITRLRDRFDLIPADSPSSTVAALRWTDDTVDALVLADSPIVVFTDRGHEVVSDDRLVRAHRNPGRIEEWRNRDGGFWVARAEPEAAHRAVRRSWPRAEVRAVLIATDGVSCGVDDYHLFDWPEVLEITAEKGPEAVLDAIRAAEEGDPEHLRWPRRKTHDDQAFAVIVFTPPAEPRKSPE
ncbi:protein phosphatase 2C domain-containing protein [Actinosynnema sp. NPDC020468]|uniref:protein phosphatase 2C domain-containing protein n=1 Tax=Actinosynnema sp. NPDC020468 TaxID=3154488 RepID=UPI0033DFDA6B